MNLEKSTKHHGGRHTGREDLAGEHKRGDAGQLILLLVFLIVWIPDSFFLHRTDFLSEKTAWYFHALPGLILLSLAGYLSWAGMRTVFGKVRETPQVITKGVFSLVRHPIYLGCILTYLGLISLTLSLLSLALWMIIVPFYWYISKFEEKVLIARFGREYEQYMEKVPMLFPVRFGK